MHDQATPITAEVELDLISLVIKKTMIELATLIDYTSTRLVRYAIQVACLL